MRFVKNREGDEFEIGAFTIENIVVGTDDDRDELCTGLLKVLGTGGVSHGRGTVTKPKPMTQPERGVWAGFIQLLTTANPEHLSPPRPETSNCPVVSKEALRAAYYAANPLDYDINDQTTYKKAQNARLRRYTRAMDGLIDRGDLRYTLDIADGVYGPSTAPLVLTENKAA